MTNTSVRYASPPGRGGATVRDSVAGLLILVSLAFTLAMAALAVLVRDTGEPVILVVLSLLAMIGVFSIFSFAVGLVRVAGDTEGGEWLQAMSASSADGILLTDSSGAALYANPSLSALSGVGEIRSIGDLERAFAGTSAAAEAMFRLCRAGEAGRDWQEEFQVGVPGRRSPEGAAGLGGGHVDANRRWLRLSLRHSGQCAPDGRPALAEWRLSDVTAQHAARVHHDRTTDGDDAGLLAACLETLASGAIAFDEWGRINTANAWVRAQTGIDASRIAAGAVTLEDVFAPASADALRRELLSGEPAPLGAGLDRDDLQLLRPDGEGSTIAARLGCLEVGGRPRYLTHIRPIAATSGTEHDEQGDIASGRGGPREFERFFAAAPIAIATVDADGEIDSANAAFTRMFGEAQAEAAPDAVLRELPSLLHEDCRDPAVKLVAAAAHGQANLAPVEIRVAGESERTGRLYVSPIRPGSGGSGEAIVYAVDTTKQRELEEHFAQSQKMQAIGQLAGGMAHDFNNVLTTIILSSDFLLSSHRPADPAFKDIMAIKQNASRAAGIVRQLLAFSRQQTLRPKVLSLTEVISDWSIWLSRILEEKIELKVAHGRDLWEVKADQTQFEQVIMNLAVNARDAMPDGGRLTIRTRNVTQEESATLTDRGMAPGEYVLCEVGDTGTGMPVEVVNKIFEPFFSTKEVGKGTGLGLSTVYGIVKQTGGYIFCDSEQGRGTTFRIYLPRLVPREAEAEDVAREPARRPERSRDLTGSGTVLLVEDEEAVRRFAARALTRQGYEVLEAGSGTEALEVMSGAENAVNLVVSDVVMPEMDGPALLKELRKSNPDLKIIFISGHAEDALKSLTDDEEFSFLPKPFQLKELVATVKETLGK